MVIKIAEKAGFCFGVKRAVDMAMDYTDGHESLLSLGQLIHNDQVTNRLEAQGLKKIDSLDNVYDETVLIRSHGVGKQIYEQSKKHGIELLDSTCPFVKKVHRIVDEYYTKGYQIIIVGNSEHPEIIGINGWCNNDALIVDSAEMLPILKKEIIALLLKQT